MNQGHLRFCIRLKGVKDYSDKICELPDVIYDMANDTTPGPLIQYSPMTIDDFEQKGKGSKRQLLPMHTHLISLPFTSKLLISAPKGSSQSI